MNTVFCLVKCIITSFIFNENIFSQVDKPLVVRMPIRHPYSFLSSCFNIRDLGATVFENIQTGSLLEDRWGKTAGSVYNVQPSLQSITAYS